MSAHLDDEVGTLGDGVFSREIGGFLTTAPHNPVAANPKLRCRSNHRYVLLAYARVKRLAPKSSVNVSPLPKVRAEP